VRILHCIPTLSGGGAERQLALIAPRLAARGHDVHVAAFRGGVYLDALRGGAVTVHMLSQRGSYDPRMPLAFVRLIRRLRPDVVQTWLAQTDVVAGAAALLCRVPWILSERSSAPAYGGSLKMRVRRWLGRHATAVVANSREGLAYWNGGGAPLREVIGNAVVVEPREPSNAIPPGDRLILYAGRLSEEKNVGRIVDAVVPILRERPGVWLAICGEGPLEADVRARVASSGVAERILLNGFVPDVWSWMRRADVLVSLSRFEGNPNAVVEALAAGCPVVLSDIPAHRELVDDTAAMIVKLQDAEAAIRATLDDRDAALRRAEAGKARVADRRVCAVADRYVDLYERVVAR
jgi:glycosyltransferase involved in cell wall biosynthesis